MLRDKFHLGTYAREARIDFVRSLGLDRRFSRGRFVLEFRMSRGAIPKYRRKSLESWYSSPMPTLAAIIFIGRSLLRSRLRAS